MLHYVPLEPYKERYTWQLSAPKTGWFERGLIKDNVPYDRINGESLRDTIKAGQVLDATGRCFWALSQVQRIVNAIDNGFIKDEDVFFFDDFWHPGIEALAYIRHQLGMKFKMFAFCYAQSVDCFDFTYSMRHWMRHYELGNAKILDGVFVTSTMLKDLLGEAGINNVFVTGLIYSSEEVRERYPDVISKRKNQVVYSSRLDPEKNPRFFLRVAHRYRSLVDPHTQFIVTTSAKDLRSSDPKILQAFKNAEEDGYITIRREQTKDQYYATLLESMVQFNCAKQDWVSFTILEATTCGCHPVYPFFRSFPETLRNHRDCLYTPWEAKHACTVIHNKMHGDEADYRDVYKPFDLSYRRILYAMGLHSVAMRNPFGGEM